MKKKWFTGQVYVNNHDVCTDPSDPWRHCALLMEVWEKYDGVPSVCFIENDGCHDHYYRHLKPLLAMICLGLTAGVRVLVLNQNVAKQSFLNLVERVMSLINMSTSRAITTRARGSERLEQLTKNRQVKPPYEPFSNAIQN